MEEIIEPYITACELTILIPCLNEADTIGSCITKALTFLSSNHILGEVLVADNGSTDGSPEIAQNKGARVIYVAEKGYGSALIQGISEALGKYVIMGDADDSYDFLSLGAFISELRNGVDLVMGNRFKGGIHPQAMPFSHRYIGNPILSMIGRLFFKSNVSDFHCGLRGFKRESILKLDLHTTGMEFASEMVVKAVLNRLIISEVPTILYPDGRSRPPHLKTWSDGWRHLRFFMLYSPRWLFLYPGIILFILGLLMTGWLITGPKVIGKVTLDLNTLLYGILAIQVGFQSINFAVYTKLFAMSEGLLPIDPKFYNLYKYITLERGIILGAVMIGIGLLVSAIVFLSWESSSFGPLDPSLSLRMVIPGTMLILMGFQIILSSFFLSILMLKRL